MANVKRIVDVEEARVEKTVTDVRAGSEGGDEKQSENKLTFGLVMTMLAFSLTFVVSEVTPVLLTTCYTLIAFDLGTIDDVIWLLLTPFISAAAVAPFVGALSDLYGRKVIILTSLAFSVIGSVLNGAAPNVAVFYIGGVFSGMGLGIQILSVLAAAADLVPPDRRGLTIACIGLGFIPFMPGALYGQLIAAHNWRWIFLLIGVIAALAFTVLAIWYKPPPSAALFQHSKKELLARINFISAFLSITGLVLFLVALNWGGNYYPWNSARVISTMTLGILILIAFFLYEVYGTKYPMFPYKRMVSLPRHFIAVNILAFTAGVNFVPVTVFWSIQVYAQYGASFRQAGLWLMPISILITCGAITSAFAFSMFKRYILWVLLFFCVCQTLGTGLMARVSATDVSSAWGPIIVATYGVGGVLLPSQVLFSVISPSDLIGTSVAFSLVVRLIGQVIGKTLLYNIFVQTLTKKAPAIIALPAVKAGIDTVPQIVELVKVFSAGPFDHYLKLFPTIKTAEQLQAILTAGHHLYAETFPILYLISIPFGVVGILSCFMLWGIEDFISDEMDVSH